LSEAPDYPLSGITVIDLGQIYNGSYATFLMAMAGADVIKIEPPGGEPLRRRAETGTGALPFAMLNSNKRKIVINLKTEAGAALLRQMTARADVVLENFSPGTMEDLGVGPEVLMAENPRLIYASGSGYGRSGPYRDNLAMDLSVQAISGVMSITGYSDRPPVRSGATLCDFLGGVHLYGAVMTALYERSVTGRGRLVEVSMQEAVYSSLASALGMMQKSGGAVPPRVGNRHAGLAIAPYNVYEAKDGAVAILCVVERHWPNLLKCMGREDLADDPRFVDNKTRVAHVDEVDALVGDWVARQGKDEVFEKVRRHGIPSAPVKDLTEVWVDPHMHERGMLEWIDHPEHGRIVVQRSPLRFEGVGQMPLQPSRALGADRDEVLGEWLGLSDDEIDGLEEAGAI
jgi:formyl-CoA transferase